MHDTKKEILSILKVEKIKNKGMKPVDLLEAINKLREEPITRQALHLHLVKLEKRKEIKKAGAPIENKKGRPGYIYYFNGEV